MGDRRLIIENDSRLSQEEINGIDFAVKVAAKSFTFIKGWNFSEYFHKNYEETSPIIYINLIINLSELDGFFNIHVMEYWREKSKENEIELYFLGLMDETIRDSPKEVVKIEDVMNEELNGNYESCPKSYKGTKLKQILNTTYSKSIKKVNISRYFTTNTDSGWQRPFSSNNPEIQVEHKVRRLLNNIINEALSDEEIKTQFYEVMIDSNLNELVPIVREYYDESTGEQYDRIHLYMKNTIDDEGDDDYDEVSDDDWEYDWWVFSIGNKKNNEYELFYNKEHEEIEDIFSKFPKRRIAELLPIWFVDTYKNIIKTKFRYDLKGIYKVLGK